MTSALLLMWAALIPGLVFGYVAHELAHWVVLRAWGRDDGLSLWPPRAGFVSPVPIPLDVRLAAVAPALVGVGVICGVVVVGGQLGAVGWGVVSGTCVQLFRLSPADRRVARGRVDY